MLSLPILLATLLTPLFGALLIFVLSNRFIKTIKCIAFMSSLVTLTLSATLYLRAYDTTGFAAKEEYGLFLINKVSFILGVDSLSAPFVLLTSFLMVLCFLYDCYKSHTRTKEYFALFLLLQTFILGAFLSLDLILFYVFFEAVLIPMFIIIGVWGDKDRVYAAYKFFLYTLFGSVFFLLGVIYIYQKTGHTNIFELQKILPTLDLDIRKVLWLSFFASFAIKIPMWPLHTWLPNAHVQAPTSASVILAGILLKMGGYGFLRFSLPLLTDANTYFTPYVSILSLIAIIYASIVAYGQDNMKKLIAYSSVAHMGFVTLGIFSNSSLATGGAIFQMISHGLISAGLFFSVGFLSDRTHTKEIASYGGIAKVMPNFAALFMVLTIASAAIPGTSAFIGEFLVLIGVYTKHTNYAAIAAVGMVLGAIYMLMLYKRVMFGALNTKIAKKLYDLKYYEFIILTLLSVFIILLGVKPMYILKMLQ